MESYVAARMAPCLPVCRLASNRNDLRGRRHELRPRLGRFVGTQETRGVGVIDGTSSLIFEQKYRRAMCSGESQSTLM